MITVHHMKAGPRDNRRIEYSFECSALFPRWLLPVQLEDTEGRGRVVIMVNIKEKEGKHEREGLAGSD